MVEPIHPFERGNLDGFSALPRTVSVDDLSLIEPVDRFGQCVVVAVTFAAGRRLDAGFSPGETIKDPQEPTGEMQSRIFQTEIEMIQYLLRVKYVRR